MDTPDEILMTRSDEVLRARIVALEAQLKLKEDAIAELAARVSVLERPPTQKPKPPAPVPHAPGRPVAEPRGLSAAHTTHR